MVKFTITAKVIVSARRSLTMKARSERGMEQTVKITRLAEYNRMSLAEEDILLGHFSSITITVLVVMTQIVGTSRRNIMFGALRISGPPSVFYKNDI